MNADAMSLSMFWAGALMVFTPVIFAAIVIGVWWIQKHRRQQTTGDRSQGTGHREQVKDDTL